MKITLIVPTLNEIEGMREIMPRVDMGLINQVLIVDGGSSDGTVEYALEHGYEVHKQGRKGLRLGLIEAYGKASGDVIITFSPDGNSVPEEIPKLIKKMKEGHDLVIVSRYRDGARSYDDTTASSFGNWLFTRMISLLFGFQYTDALVMFRAYKKDVPQKLGITKIRSRLYESIIGRYISWEPQLSVRAAKARLKIAEIPGDEPVRVEDKHIQARGLLPTSRIYHFRSGFACLYMVLEEFAGGAKPRL